MSWLVTFKSSFHAVPKQVFPVLKRRCQALKTELRHTCVPTILQIYMHTHKTLRSRSVTAVPMPLAG